MEDLALLLHHLVEDRLRIVTEEKECDDADVAVCALISPCFTDGLPSIEFLVIGADEDEQEGRATFAFFCLIDQELERVWIKRACPDVTERDIFLQS